MPMRLPRCRCGGSCLNSLVISLAGMVGAVLTGSMAGYAFARRRWRGRTWWFALLLLSLVLPTQVLLIPRFLIFELLGWVGTYKPLIVPAWLGGGAFTVLLFWQFFRRVSPSAEEAAVMDGASVGQVYWQVMLPMAKPAVVTAAILSFVVHWQMFLDPLIYLSDFETYPISLGLRMYQSLAGTWANHLMVASLLALVPVAVVFLWGQRYFTDSPARNDPRQRVGTAGACIASERVRNAGFRQENSPRR